MKAKFWKVRINRITWDSPQYVYFNNRAAALECYHKEEYADYPEYAGMFSEKSVIHAYDITASVPDCVKIAYYNSYKEYALHK